MLRYIGTLALAIASALAQADGLDLGRFGKVDRIGLHIGSQHFPARDHNNFNPGAYVRSDRDWAAGFYFNSEEHWSVYAARDFNLAGPIGIRAGLVTGYRIAPVFPLAALTLDLGEHVRLAFIPPVEKSSAVLHLGIEVAWP